MARLPVTGDDAGQWGGVLNEFLSVSLNGDGTLRDAVLQGTVRCATMAQVRAISTTDHALAYFVTDSGQEGLYSYDSSDASTTDNTGITLVSANGRRFKRRFDGQVNVKWFGARANGSTDDSAAIQAAVDFAKFVAVQNGGNVRFPVLFPPGIYRLLTAINCTNSNGIYLVGSSGRYVNTHINGNTGAQIFDFTGSIMGGCEGFTFTSYSNESNPSTIGVQFALSEDTNGNQIGGLNCSIRNCFFQMDDNPTMNGGLGTIGVLNVRAEEFSASDLLIKANTGIIFSNQRDLAPLGVTFTASSPFCSVIRGAGSMGVVDCFGQMSIQNIQARQPAIMLLNTNSIRYHGYLVKSGTTGGNETAIGLYGQNDNIHISGTIEGFSRISTFGVMATGIHYTFITANQSAPTTEVFNVTGALIKDSEFTVSFGNPGEFNNGRFFIYHAPISSGDSPATGGMQTCRWNCGYWVDNTYFVSANVLKNASDCDFNSGQPFIKRNMAVIDTKAYRQPLGTTSSDGTNIADITSSVIRFLKADKTTTNANNGGFYEATIRGVVGEGTYTSGGNCMVNFEAHVLVSQNQNGNLNNVVQSTTILSKSITSPAYLNITDVIASLDLSSAHAQVRLTVKSSGSGNGEPVYFSGCVELISDFLVNQSVIFA